MVTDKQQVTRPDAPTLTLCCTTEEILDKLVKLSTPTDPNSISKSPILKPYKNK